MLNALQTRNLTTMFRIFDASGNNVISWADYDRLLHRFADRVGIEEGSTDFNELRERYHRDWQALRHEADAGFDGTVGLDEWLRYHDRAFSTPEGYDVAVTSVAEMMIALADHDGDGMISRDNYRSLLDAFHVDNARADQAFARLDRNRNGQISTEELMQAVGEFIRSEDPDAAGHWLWGKPVES